MDSCGVCIRGDLRGVCLRWMMHLSVILFTASALGRNPDGFAGMSHSEVVIAQKALQQSGGGQLNAGRGG